ncbi:hypothetical protein V1264_004728 [Littorina saxatilis]|uniref:Uncharacterized protein n=1 Tax=Littorina saxatilis TaxID=31220 RepID=A0AAN9G6X9_9CAEN
MRILVALAILQLFSLTCLAADAVSKTSTWRRLGSGFQSMVSYQAVETCRSRLECVQRGCRYTHCSRVAFQRSTKHCYLLPVTQALRGGTGDDVIIFEQGDPICPVEDVSIANAEVFWHHTLTSVEGDVNCHSHYTGSINDVTVKCSADNTWTTEGQCVNTYWLNPVSH